MKRFRRVLGFAFHPRIWLATAVASLVIVLMYVSPFARGVRVLGTFELSIAVEPADQFIVELPAELEVVREHKGAVLWHEPELTVSRYTGQPGIMSGPAINWRTEDLLLLGGKAEVVVRGSKLVLSPVELTRWGGSKFLWTFVAIPKSTADRDIRVVNWWIRVGLDLLVILSGGFVFAYSLFRYGVSRSQARLNSETHSEPDP